MLTIPVYKNYENLWKSGKLSKWKRFHPPPNIRLEPNEQNTMHVCTHIKGAYLGGGGTVGSMFWKLIRGTPSLLEYSRPFEEASEVKPEAFKKYWLERFIKDGTAIPASRLRANP